MVPLVRECYGWLSGRRSETGADLLGDQVDLCRRESLTGLLQGGL
jgi:hypothetical protein